MGCEYCGKLTSLQKMNSGKVIPIEDKYCSQCGESLTEPKQKNKQTVVRQYGANNSYIQHVDILNFK